MQSNFHMCKQLRFTKLMLFFLLVMVIVLDRVQAQELLSGTDYNPLLRNEKPITIDSRGSTLTLPFIDDFSYCQRSKYPDPLLWQSNQTYVNCTYPLRPPTIGVATFDGLDASGVPYDTTQISFNPKTADTLRSLSIDLSSYTEADSLYLSFYFQAQGLGDTPNNNDSLILEFLRFNGSWSKRWGVNGQAFNEFKIVMIPIKATEFFHDLFQFRFISFASVNGNNDHWHLDYVKLDANRNINDTLMNDIAIERFSSSVLRNYTAMPWNQFKADALNEIAPAGTMYFKNNYGIAKNTTYSFKIEEVNSSSVLATQPLQSFNFNALNRDSAQVTAIDPTAILSQTNARLKSTYFCYATGTGDLQSANDTVIQFLEFDNYLAYDDGSAEKVYGILGTGAKAALRYHVNTPDTVQAIRIHFARLQGVQSGLLFSVLVWSKLNPEIIRYQQDFNKPDYIDSLNGFATYILDSGIVVSDTFYVGWLQSQQDLIYMGFDRNTNSKQHLFYNIGSAWQNTIFDGSLMLRPVLGKRADLNVGVPSPSRTSTITLYPVPATDILTLDGLHTMQASRYEIYSITGQCIQQDVLYAKSISITDLIPGFYVFKLILPDGTAQSFKFVKNQ